MLPSYPQPRCPSRSQVSPAELKEAWDSSRCRLGWGRGWRLFLLFRLETIRAPSLVVAGKARGSGGQTLHWQGLQTSTYSWRDGGQA